MSIQNARQQIENFPSQCTLIDTPVLKISGRDVEGIVIAGMGGSALSGEILKNYLEYKHFKLPVFIVRDYKLPSFVNKKYLVFVQSYSGNTEETVSVLRDAYIRQLKPIVISTGGILVDLAKKYNLPIIFLPNNFQPRLAIGYFLFAELSVLNSIFDLGIDEEIEKIREIKWSTHENYAKKIVEKIDGIPIIYASNMLSSVPVIWKALINECSKSHCFANVFSEQNHNEMMGFISSKNFYVILLQDEEDHYRIKKRMYIFQEEMKKLNVKTLLLNFKGSSFFQRILSLIHIGMWIAFHLAIKNDQDPEKVELIEDFKKKLGRFI
ncbi:MAG: bifunctional phosphoglucose/phosphomannose isomerase [Candidatus Woesearchaeota archaeon]